MKIVVDFGTHLLLGMPAQTGTLRWQRVTLFRKSTMGFENGNCCGKNSIIIIIIIIVFYRIYPPGIKLPPDPNYRLANDQS